MSVMIQEDLPFCVYIIEEVDTPEIPAQTAYRKIGWLTKVASRHGPYYERERILNQGNVRGNEVVFAVDVPTKEAARGLESFVHNYLDRIGCIRRGEETDKTGHSEWFKVTRTTAEESILDAYHVYQTDPYRITGVACGKLQYDEFQIPDITEALVNMAEYRARYSRPEETMSTTADDPTLFRFRT